MRYFNTSGPNIAKEHYTLERTDLIEKGIDLVTRSRYFTIWAPRQTGKSTYFRQLATHLEQLGYLVCHINFESYKNESKKTFTENLIWEFNRKWHTQFDELDLGDIFLKLQKINDQKFVLIIDEVEGINPAYFNDFLHAIRNMYHSRETNCLKSVILVGVSNISGIIGDNASPFNIADNLFVPYFTQTEVLELLAQHESESTQKFDESVKQKIYQITAGQPGLVNGFAQELITRYKDKTILELNDYLCVEDWYLTEAIDKNFSNILNKAKEERPFVERLLFTEDTIPFEIDRPGIKLLYINGIIKKDHNGSITFWVPFYKKRLFNAFYPYTNGEKNKITTEIYSPEYFTQQGELRLEKLIKTYKDYVKRRSFRAFMTKNEDGSFNTLKESACIYSFETFIFAAMEELQGKIYREANTGLGRCDIIINIGKAEFLIETKVYRSFSLFDNGKKQVASYCKSLALNKGLYIVFCPNSVRYPEPVKEQTETINGVEIITYLIQYDEEKDF